MIVEAIVLAVKVSMQSSMGDAGTRLLNPGMEAQVGCEACKKVGRRGMEAPVRREGCFPVWKKWG